MREAAEVIALANEVGGMTAFFALTGSAINNGRSRVAYRMLTACGLVPQRAWCLVDGWERMIVNECNTGWTPECTAMGFVINDVDKWWCVQWSMLVGQFALDANASSVEG